MTRPFPKRIPLQSPISNFRVEHSDDGWMVWLAANGDWTIGTYILLNSNGTIERVTWLPDGSDRRIEI